MISTISFIIIMLLGIIGTFFGIQGIRRGWKYNIPISYAITYWIIVLGFTIISIIVSQEFNINIAERVVVSMLFTFNFLLAYLLILKIDRKEKISFKEILLNPIISFKSIKSVINVADYPKTTAEEFARANNIEYISNAIACKMNEESNNEVLAFDNRYILLHTANDGLPTCPIEWYGKFAKGKGKKSYEKILDNQESFNCITNLDEIISNIIKIYKNTIDDYVVIDANAFAIRLEDEPTEGYNGKAKLVITKDTIINSKIKLGKEEEAKEYFINDFLDHFIGWNFGVVIKNNPELEKELKEFNQLVISKGIRKYAGPGFDVRHNEYVKPYKLNVS